MCSGTEELQVVEHSVGVECDKVRCLVRVRVCETSEDWFDATPSNVTATSNCGLHSAAMGNEHIYFLHSQSWVP